MNYLSINGWFRGTPISGNLHVEDSSHNIFGGSPLLVPNIAVANSMNLKQDGWLLDWLHWVGWRPSGPVFGHSHHDSNCRMFMSNITRYPKALRCRNPRCLTLTIRYRFPDVFSMRSRMFYVSLQPGHRRSVHLMYPPVIKHAHGKSLNQVEHHL